jgi:hypothetical protein
MDMAGKESCMPGQNTPMSPTSGVFIFPVVKQVIISHKNGSAVLGSGLFDSLLEFGEEVLFFTIQLCLDRLYRSGGLFIANLIDIAQSCKANVVGKMLMRRWGGGQAGGNYPAHRHWIIDEW